MEWFVEYHADVWDKQNAEDLEAGRFDSLLDEVEPRIVAAREAV